MNIELSINGKVAKMKIEGILNSENAYLLQEKLTEVLNSEATLLELDLLDCRNISSTGIGKFCCFTRILLQKGEKLKWLEVPIAYMSYFLC